MTEPKPRLWKFAFGAQLMLIMAGLAYLTVLFSIDRDDYYRANGVVIEPVEAGEPITLTVGREIVEPFEGYYKVRIDGLRGEFFCNTNTVGPRNYGTDSTLPDPVFLQWWANGEGANSECVDRLGPKEAPILPPDTYTMETCHGVIRPLEHRFWPFPPVEKCVITVFEVFPGGGAQRSVQSLSTTIEDLEGQIEALEEELRK